MATLKKKLIDSQKKKVNQRQGKGQRKNKKRYKVLDMLCLLRVVFGYTLPCIQC
jgi:hypothetical protein